MGRVGSALDNALAESFVSTLKAEMGDRPAHQRSGEDDRLRLHRGYYNPIHMHSSLGYLSPADYERAIVEEARVAQSRTMAHHQRDVQRHPALHSAMLLLPRKKT